MTKVKYEVWLPKSKKQLESLFTNLFRSKSKHIIIRVLDNYIKIEELIEVLKGFEKQINNYKKSHSIVLLTEQYEEIPDFIPVAPTEEEAVDIIDFEEIERDLFLNG